MSNSGIAIVLLLAGILLLVIASDPIHASFNTNLIDGNISFLDLNDTPNSYSGQALKVLQVNAAQNGLQFTTVSGIDTNCAALSSCENVLYKNTDINVHDANTTKLTVQASGGQKYIYGSGSAIEIGVISTCIFTSPLIPGFCNGVKFFIGDAGYGNAVGLTLVDIPSFLAQVGATAINGVFWAAPGDLPDFGTIPNGIKCATFKTRTSPDGNWLYEYVCGNINKWIQVGTQQSQYSDDFLLQTGDFNNPPDKNRLTFANGFDVLSGTTNYTGNINATGLIHTDSNLDVDGNATIDGNIVLKKGNIITGFVYTFTATNTFSCNTICNAGDGNIFGNLTCIDGILSAGGSHATCSDTAGQRTCICQN